MVAFRLVSSPHSVVSLVMNDRLGTMWKESVAIYLYAIPEWFSTRDEQNPNISQLSTIIA
jgi:hypothetical protein